MARCRPHSAAVPARYTVGKCCQPSFRHYPEFSPDHCQGWAQPLPIVQTSDRSSGSMVRLRIDLAQRLRCPAARRSSSSGRSATNSAGWLPSGKRVSVALELQTSLTHKEVRHISVLSVLIDQPMPASPRHRNLIVRDIVDRTGIDDAMIERLVRTFYARARLDPLIGPIFAKAVKDWDEHIARLCAFWSSVALMSGRYHGQPMVAHLPLPIHSPHFDRWLELFAETAQEVCPPAAAAHFLERAHRIADSLEMGIAVQKDDLRPKRVRPASTMPPKPDGG